MAELTVDLTYGTALMEAARELGKEDQILDEAQAVAQLIEEEPDLHKFINYPGVSADEKNYILVDKRRTMNFGRIVKVYKSLIEKEEGVSYGTVYSVVKLSDDRLAELEKQTSELLQMNVKLENELDPRLLAGFKILVEGKIIDASYRKRFDELASQMNLS